MTWRLEEIGTEWDTRWDALAGRSQESGFMQSSAWAAFKRAEGYSTVRYGLFQEEELQGGVCLLDYSRQGIEGFLICPEGPILPWNDLSAAREGLRMLCAAAQARAAQHGGLGMRIEPRLAPPRPTLLRNWVRSPVDLNPVHSLYLDLMLSNEELLAQMEPKGRYNVRLSLRHGVQVTRSTQMQDLARFYPLFAETALRNDFFAEPYSFFLNLGATLFPAHQAELFFAEWGGETLAAVLVIFFGRRATYLYGGSSGRNRRVMPTYALHWSVIQAARERGCVEYDLYGYDPFDQPRHPYAGFTRFKRRFGGRRVDMIGAYDLIFYDRLADRVAERLTV